MTFKLDILKKPNLEKITKEVSIGGIELTIKLERDEALESAIDKMQTPNIERIALDDLRRKNQGLSKDTTWLFIVGEYAIDKWNVVDADDMPLAINGDNFILLINSLPPKERGELVDAVLGAFFVGRLEYKKMTAEVVKKPSTATSGKPKK
ncbi:hypothetical protein [Moraxella bovoculi]|uniref:hypothetical protein n=1 Tax=Moraxella TaxID=475 RepID=UPI0006248E92|nr:hypothetical protein [Moraxella bovoculi]AKG10885.1 hypothetical protein AAX07_01410 [Moraxella bovoculi]